ncbi:glycosyltransferase [Halobacillus sp. BBL2006]|uniref:glycosyltransferase n=1 Tax=Halobacillus sp. BBL2006 TaxID=1543706 RepID=UPI0005440742|nr:glycosyltransferase [Halobacillus sp. BBL2006]KHE69235.1 glycosyl transferase family 1 [Halobacillus sp. BBL2006]
MKKKILFVMHSLHCGGAEKSLISLLESINYTHYEVDLLLFKKEGIFLSKVPEEVNLLDEPVNYKLFDMPIKKAVFHCLKEGKLTTAINRVQAGYIFKYEANRAKCDQKVWKYVSKSIKGLETYYDMAVGYLEKAPIYFINEKVTAKKKIGWVHTNYSNSGMDSTIDYPHYESLDYIVTVSGLCKESLIENFKKLSEKITVIHNILSPSIINKMSLIKNVETEMDDEAIKIVTVARLCHVKGIDIAIRACRLLIENGYNIEWYVLGTGSKDEIEEYEKLIQKENLQKSFILLGVKDNPYPYIRKTDIYVQPSRYEGKSIAIEEAKILNKPVIITNFSTSKDQIEDEYNGLIVEIDPHSVFHGIVRMIEEDHFRDRLITNVQSEQLGNEHEIKKFYALFN